MKELLASLKPNKYNLTFAALFLGWQYFYAYSGSQFKLMSEARHVFSTFLSIVNWDNTFIRGGSMVVLWLLVALVVFVFFISFESVSIFIHNKVAESKFANRPAEDGNSPRIKVKRNILMHVIDTLWFSGGGMITYFSLNILSDMFEGFRFWFMNMLTLIFQKGGEKAVSQNTITLVVSFLTCFVLWFLVGSLVTYLFKMGYISHQDEELIEEHFGAVIES